MTIGAILPRNIPIPRITPCNSPWISNNIGFRCIPNYDDSMINLITIRTENNTRIRPIIHPSWSWNWNCNWSFLQKIYHFLISNTIVGVSLNISIDTSGTTDASPIEIGCNVGILAFSRAVFLYFIKTEMYVATIAAISWSAFQIILFR